MDPHGYYLEQSSITDPGAYWSLLDDLASDVEGLCRAAQGLIIHHLDGGRLFGYAVPQDRRLELDTCSVVEMLQRICDLDGGPLTQERPPERRLAGYCRDFATLFCSMARHKGIPARVRSGVRFRVRARRLSRWGESESAACSEQAQPGSGAAPSGSRRVGGRTGDVPVGRDKAVVWLAACPSTIDHWPPGRVLPQKREVGFSNSGDGRVTGDS